MRFGDVINYNGGEFVFLVATEKIIYLAKIANKELSKNLIDQRNKVFTRGCKDMVYRQASTAWCFVTLCTEEFKERIAHYGTPENECSFDDISNIIGNLNFEDQNNIKKEIAGDSGVSTILRELIKDIAIQES